MLNRADAIRTALTVALLAIVLALSLNAGFYKSTIIDTYMALEFGGVLVILLVVRASWLNCASVAVGSLIMAGLNYRVLGFQPKLIAAISFIGLSSLAVLGTRTIWAGKQDRTHYFCAFLGGSLFVTSYYIAPNLLDFTEALHPKTFDLFLYSVDCSLRAQFSFLLGQLFARHFWFHAVSLAFYVGLPLPVALVYAAQLRLKNKGALTVMLTFLVTGPLGVLFYNMVPACGPVHLFGGNFPWHPMPIPVAMHMVLETVLIKGARNAIPSLHMAWVLLAWWNSRGLAPWIRAIALAFVIFTVFATLGTGEHYFVDLVVAFPFALMVQALCLYSLPFKYSARRVAFLFGIFVSLAWMALVSFAIPFFWISPVISWAMVIATIAISSLLLHRLQSAELTNEPVEAAGKRQAADAGKAEASVPPKAALEAMVAAAASASASSLPAGSVTPAPGMTVQQ
jgi:hypothetical protein